LPLSSDRISFKSYPLYVAETGLNRNSRLIK
jgi:hypothetical protein